MWTNRKSKIYHGFLLHNGWYMCRVKTIISWKPLILAEGKKKQVLGRHHEREKTFTFVHCTKKNSLVLIIEIGSDELEHILGYIFQPVPWSTNARGEKSQNCALTFCWPKKKLIVAEKCLLILLVLKKKNR